MGQVLLWALGTGFVTGAVWFAILFFRRHQAPALPKAGDDPGALEDMQRRVMQLEERLDATEHVLVRERHEQARKRP